MNDRKNFLNLLDRKTYERMPIYFTMTSTFAKKFMREVKKKPFRVPAPPFVPLLFPKPRNPLKEEQKRALYPVELKKDTGFDDYHVAMEKGSEDCLHLRRMYHPLERAETVEEINAYPFPVFSDKVTPKEKVFCGLIRLLGKSSMGLMQCTIWEKAWYLRSMERLMEDMLLAPELADALLDRVTENSAVCARYYALSGADTLFLGDDIGMQSTIQMSVEMYCRFLKPRLKRVIDAAREVNPNIKILYHSCGYIEPFLPHLIEVGVDVLNPVQPESMNIDALYRQYHDKLIFMGGLGTQTLMPFGTPEEVSAEVNRLDALATGGGFIICPTHDLEPEVPVANLKAFFRTARALKGKKLS